jgi:NTE family protein
LAGFGSADFAMRKQSIEAGRVAMQKLVPQLKSAIEAKAK